ncbi:50S ribosomal protein L19e [Fervidicoccus fontis]|uniref:Large ribosomal subunit protein eL19 n=2 Tax=Fervidicoccus fontis TaxID=683846 RepID=I0A0I5_FERFK|nr:50S ribosomal protein L19e [Fervidicoccus fontis]AFH42492.1 50S ribosomal protein L19e [Fervidicoccus fontis Kam940]MBE9391105.1 50S ribosomal protein L19e [Fervidicoccus fontis]PMB75717.1 MAG: 50S ribosomal protein L19e [Fervidicoccus fontis]PMB78103.1 MAG: 50S ribosomal protein L19e [Fervidicoccus fontis]HEW64169.1 50S ribosomal protein L19e [Fervidicoccus fontis]
MSDYTLQKRLASKILGIGESRVRIYIKSDDDREDLENAITAEDIKKLIKRGVITEEPEKSNSRGRWRELKEKRSKGQRRGPGKRKGVASARIDPKRRWISSIRKMRRYLKYLRDKKIITTQQYRRYYKLAKGGAFSSLSVLRMHIEKEIGQKR